MKLKRYGNQERKQIQVAVPSPFVSIFVDLTAAIELHVYEGRTRDPHIKPLFAVRPPLFPVTVFIIQTKEA